MFENYRRGARVGFEMETPKHATYWSRAYEIAGQESLLPPRGYKGSWWLYPPASLARWRWYVIGSKGQQSGSAATKGDATVAMQFAYLELGGFYMELRELDKEVYSRRDEAREKQLYGPPTKPEPERKKASIEVGLAALALGILAVLFIAAR